MPISAEDRATAKKAYGEMQQRDMNRAFSILLGGLLLIPVILKFIFDHEKSSSIWAVAVSAVGIGGGLWLILLINVISYLWFQARYVTNLKVVAELEQKYAAEHPHGLEQAIQGEPEKKALLWKLDAFLSGKKQHRNP